MSLFFFLPTARFVAVPQVSAVSDPLASTATDASNDHPISSIKFLTDGTIEEATGDDGSALSYSQVGTWLDEISGVDNTDWEINFTVDSEDNGDPGTWAGATRGSYIALSTERTYSWQKDGLDLGTAGSEVTVTVRQVSDTANAASKANVTYNATIEA